MKTILIVDDSPEILLSINMILSGTYRTKSAKSGRVALKIATSAEPPDLILLDVDMPGMDGFQVCHALKKDPSTASIPVIFVTGHDDVSSENRGFEVGGVDYIAKPINAQTLLNRVKTHLSLVNAERLDRLSRSAILMLGEAGHYNDEDTGNHIWRMAKFARLVADKLGWPKERAEVLELAAPLHDTGKIGIPDNILKAPRKLTPGEWEIMKTHAQIGYGILSQSDDPVFRMAAEIAQNHHERWEGSGYPSGLSREEIPESARIVAVADVYDALTMVRPYKKAWADDDAFNEIERSAGSHFDPRVCEAFLGLRDQIIETRIAWSDDHY